MSNKSEATWHPNSGPEVPLVDLVRQAIDLLRDDAETIDGEWGHCRNVDGIRADGADGIGRYGWEQVDLSDRLAIAIGDVIK